MNYIKEILKKIGRVFMRFCVLVYCKIVYRLKVIGKENIPKEGAVIFCGNHRTYLDPPLIVITAGRHMRFMAKEELRKNPLFAFLCVVFEGIWVKRDSKDINALKTALKTLKDGGNIALFPEGTRNGIEKGEKIGAHAHNKKRNYRKFFVHKYLYLSLLVYNNPPPCQAFSMWKSFRVPSSLKILLTASSALFNLSPHSLASFIAF